jgi:hypothetical protein
MAEVDIAKRGPYVERVSVHISSPFFAVKLDAVENEFMLLNR